MAVQSNQVLETPLLLSSHLSHRLPTNHSVYLKLENLQPCHSYKLRGLSHFVQHQLSIHGPSLHIICASGGNAGLAAACASQSLGVKCTIFLPEGVAPSTRDFLKRLGAHLVVVGKFYLETLRAAEGAVKNDESAVLAPAYDDPIVWEGHSTMIHEIKQQLPQGKKPQAIVCSVGGGGLLGGIILGCKNVGWDDVPIIALETHGANCFLESMSANLSASVCMENSTNITIKQDPIHNVKLAHIHHLTSKASSLGASEPAAGVVKMALERKGSVTCVSVPDELAMQTGRLFADDHKMLVELACSTTLAPLYSPTLASQLFPPSSSTETDALVFIVCGGFKVSNAEMAEYGRIVAEDVAKGGSWEVRIDQQTLDVPKDEVEA